jgi:GWxTD domain-containing protein
VVAYAGVPLARMDSVPDVMARARATATFGVDSVVPLYVEAYGAAAGAARLPVRIAARGERDALLWSDTASLERRGADASGGGLALFDGVLRVPVPRLAIGVAALDVVVRPPVPNAAPNGSPGGSPNGARGAADSARAALFVSLGADLPASTFEEMLGYLRYYATPERLRALREAPPAARGAAWAAFLRESDPVSATPEHEGLRDYFARLRTANLRFGEEGTPGWLTERGMAYIVLGEPDQIVDPTEQDPSAKGRTQIWEYRGEHVQLTFVDRTGFGRWQLTPASATELQAAMRRRLVP